MASGRKGRVDVNVQVTVNRNALMSLGDSGPWPDQRVATFVFGGGSLGRIVLRVEAVDLPRLAELVSLAQARMTEGGAL